MQAMRMLQSIFGFLPLHTCVVNRMRICRRWAFGLISITSNPPCIALDALTQRYRRCALRVKPIEKGARSGGGGGKKVMIKTRKSVNQTVIYLFCAGYRVPPHQVGA